MNLQIHTKPDPDLFLKACFNMQADPKVKGLLALLPEGNNFTPSHLDGGLQKLGIPIFGGVFPEVLHKKNRLSQGFVLLGLPKKPRVAVIGPLSDSRLNFTKILEQNFTPTSFGGCMFVLVDGFATRINDLIESLFELFGLSIDFLGGGAGSLSMHQKPCLITNQGLLQDKAVLALLDVKSGTGVKHGWEVVTGPFKVTKSEKNTIFTLESEPAFLVYQRVIQKYAQAILTKSNFFDLAKNFPIGITKLDAEKLVRDPIKAQEDGSLVCVGEIPSETYVHILTGDNPSLVRAAREALLTARKNFNNGWQDKTVFFFDCISRALFLGDHFSEEIEAVNTVDTPLIGALTLGEIANSGKDYLEFHNKTAVVGILDL